MNPKGSYLRSYDKYRSLDGDTIELRQDPFMSLMDIALRTGVPLIDIEDLVQGTVTEALAERLGVPQLALQEFVTHGQASAQVAHRLGMSMAAAEELVQSLGCEGAIGLVLGLLLGSSNARRKATTAE